MAPMKRSHGQGNGETYEVLESASSSLRRDSNKRQRVALRDDSEIVSREESHITESELEAPTSTQRQGTIREEYERERDQVSVVPESRDQAAVERGAEEIKRYNEQVLSQADAGNQEAECGVLESITCINFMCHEHLEVKLGPNINFIIGHNGSGKSAVLSAITLCLGGKATETNRGGSLKHFIKNGKDYATLIVKIKNQGGENAYKRDLYGPSIIVERHFSTNGTSGFKIKASNGRIISTKRSELDEITDYYALQLNNPCNVLTQDMARQFLNSSTPADKYRFFVKGVQLEQLDQDYKVVADHLDGVDAQLVHQREANAELAKAAKAAKEKARAAERQGTLYEKRSRLRWQMAWAQVEDQEKRLADTEQALTEKEAIVEKRKEEAGVMEEQYDDKCALLDEAQQSLREMRESHEPLAQQQEQAKTAFTNHREAVLGSQHEQRAIRSALDGHKETVQINQNKLDEEYGRLEAANGGSEALKLAEIKTAEEEVEDLRREKGQHQENLVGLEQEKKAAIEAEHAFKPTVEGKRTEMEKARLDLEMIERRGNEQMASFHRNMPRLLKNIEQDRRYRKKPIGPIGLHVRLLDPQWSSIIEKTFGKTLEGFVVTSKHDQNVLSSAMKQVDCQQNILVGRDQPLNIAAHEPDAAFTTILRVLKIDNDLVRNQLVIAHGIEQTALFERDQIASDTMHTEGRPLPRNVKVGCAHHPIHKGFGKRYSTGPSGGAKLDPIARWDGPVRMKTDREAQIRMRKDTLDTAKYNFNEAQNKARSLQNASKRSGEAIERHKKRTIDLKVQCDRADEHLENLQRQLEEAAPQDGKLDALKGELESAKTQVKHYEAQLQLSRDATDELGEQGRSLKASLDAIDARIASAASDVQASERLITSAQDARTISLRSKNQAFATVTLAEENVNRVRTHLTEAQETVSEFTTEATKICDRVNVTAPYNSLETKFNSLETQIRAAEANLGGDRESVSRAAVDTMSRYRDALEDYGKLEDLSVTLTRSLINRRERWKLFRSFITVRARSGFVYLLSERGFRGQMVIDHTSKQLELRVEPNSSLHLAANARGGRATKTLSGGEKSFSTICMLLALWDAMGSPIRCLDEFDVFMDSVNRDVSMRLMLQAARRSVGRQYILITPQAMGGVELGRDVRVCRLLDPERGQRSLEGVGVGA
ncbi:MAG: Structural maintenance of chromosomes protein 6 [Chrysothrix sp. TS-e1954]|nr:MAG: Structural maintenance of chromosomes protein 6 [Chrysothrix sp. TS-e1954]